MPKCFILVGLPGVGKSTWLKAQPFASHIVSSDAIIDKIAADNMSTYNEVFKDAVGLADKLFWRNLDIYAEEGCTFYVDRTNMSVKSRQRIIDAVNKHGGYSFEAVVFTKPHDQEWQRRLNSRPGKTIPQQVLDSMAKNYEEPTEAEGFDKVTFAQ